MFGALEFVYVALDERPDGHFRELYAAHGLRAPRKCPSFLVQRHPSFGQPDVGRIPGDTLGIPAALIWAMAGSSSLAWDKSPRPI